MGQARWTTRNRRLVERFVQVAAARLRLADWTVLVDFDEPAADGTWAECAPHEGQKRAIIRFGRGFLDLSGPDQRQTLAHELLHCHLFDLQFTFAKVTGQLPKARAAFAEAVLDDRVEWATDALADAFVALVADLPVPADPSAVRRTGDVVPLPGRAPTPVRAAAKRPPRRP